MQTIELTVEKITRITGCPVCRAQPGRPCKALPAEELETGTVHAQRREQGRALAEYVADQVAKMSDERVRRYRHKWHLMKRAEKVRNGLL